MVFHSKLSLIFVLAVLAATAVEFMAEPDVGASVFNSAVSVKGILRCGSKSGSKTKVYLYRNNTEDAKEILGEQEAGPTGLFQINVNTVGRLANETGIVPTLRVRHNCDVEPSENKERSFQLSIPKEFVSLGRTAKKVYDIGELNLEVEYPSEKRVKLWKA